MNCWISSSSTSADWVSRITSPSASISGSPPTESPIYCSPNKPAVRMAAVVSRDNWPSSSASSSRMTRASYQSVSRSMALTRPTVTPAMVTRARGLRLPILAKFASSRKVSPGMLKVSPLTRSPRNSNPRMPASMNRPTPSSIVLPRFILSPHPAKNCDLASGEPSEHHCSQDEIEPQHRERGVDYGARSSTRDPFCRRHQVVPLEYRNPGHHQGEYQALDHAVADISYKTDTALHVAPVRALEDTQPLDPDQVPAIDADDTETDGQ